MEVTMELTQTQELVCNMAEAAIGLVVSISTSKGIEILGAGLADLLIPEPDALKPKYVKAIKTTTKVAGKVFGGRLAAAYAGDLVGMMKGACYGYNAGRKMAEGQN